MNEMDTQEINDDMHEELVAYLDGELDSESSERVERRLAENAAYRRELQQLQRTWDMLDDLPKAEVGDRFTQTTVEMVVLSAQEDLEDVKEQVHQRSRKFWAFAGGGILAASIASYWICTSILYRPSRELLCDLPVIEDVDLYRVADSVEFLQLLDEKKLFDAEVDDAL